MAAINWTAIKRALHAWLCASTGLPTDRVIWSHKGPPKRATPYISASLDMIQRPGADWIDYEDAAAPAAGAELAAFSRGPRRPMLLLQCIGTEDTGLQVLELLSDAISALPLYQEEISLAGAGIGSITDVRYLSGGAGGVLEPRAICEVQLHVASQAEGTATYVEKVEVRPGIYNPAGDLLEESGFLVSQDASFDEGFSTGFEV